MTGSAQILRIGKPDPAAPEVVLASSSPSRRRLLASAGLPAVGEAAQVDEAAVKAGLAGEGADAGQVAETLAELKAQRIARRYPGALVIGADQMLECNGVWFDKPVDRNEAVEHLQALSGKTHKLVSSACVVRDGACLWHHGDHARLTMRPLSDGFIDAYLTAMGEHALASVGAYQLEGLGAQLFSRVEGDYFTILGLPLLPLLEFLRHHGVLVI
jgi:septum formation protein